MIEIHIKVSDECQTLRVKHLIYNADLYVSHDDKTLKELVDKAISDFKGSSSHEVLITIKMEW